VWETWPFKICMKSEDMMSNIVVEIVHARIYKTYNWQSSYIRSIPYRYGKSILLFVNG